MVKKRVITALVLLPVAIAAVWFDQPLPWFTVFMVVWGLAAVHEFYRMVTVAKVTPLASLGLVATLLIILSPHLDQARTPLLLTIIAMVSLVWLLMLPRKEGAFTAWAWTVAGVLYVGWLLSYLVALRGMEGGRNWVFFALFTTFASDSAAFFIGRAFGKRPLAPHISPRKTWEGAIAGVVGAVALSLLFLLPTPLALPVGPRQVVVLGALVSVFGQLGGLVESLLKRNSGVKDSSNLLPGHGGLLDRQDSVVFAGVVVYFYVSFGLSGA